LRFNERHSPSVLVAARYGFVGVSLAFGLDIDWGPATEGEREEGKERKGNKQTKPNESNKTQRKAHSLSSSFSTPTTGFLLEICQYI
jgi:hypothetical protein